MSAGDRDRKRVEGIPDYYGDVPADPDPVQPWRERIPPDQILDRIRELKKSVGLDVTAETSAPPDEEERPIDAVAKWWKQDPLQGPFAPGGPLGDMQVLVGEFDTPTPR